MKEATVVNATPKKNGDTQYWEVELEIDRETVKGVSLAGGWEINSIVAVDVQIREGKMPLFVREGETAQAQPPRQQTQPPPAQGPKNANLPSVDKFTGWFNALKAWMTAEENQDRIKGVLGHVTQEQCFQAMGRLVQYVKTLKDTGGNPIQSNVMKCTFDSVLDVLVKLIEIDIPFGDGRIYLIPYGNVLEFQIGYLGVCFKVMQQNPDIKSLEAKMVFVGQKWEVGSGPNGDYLTISGEGKASPDYSNVDACIMRLRKVIGGRLFEFCEVLPKADLETIRSKSKMKSGGPWKEFTGEMYKKATIRRGTKFELQLALGSASGESLRRLFEHEESQFDMDSTVSVQTQEIASPQEVIAALNAASTIADINAIEIPRAYVSMGTISTALDRAYQRAEPAQLP
jgi:recombinational DNA repair protein RecT